jgi:hypothetical protein
MTNRLAPKDRADALLSVALRLAAADGWRTLTHDRVAIAAGVSRALVIARLGGADQMRRSIMRAAVRERCVCVVAEGLCLGSPQARGADEALKKAAAAWVAR